MKNGTALSVEGGADLERALASLANDVSDKIARQAARAGSVVLRDAIKDLVPRGPGKHGKHGRDEIRISQPRKAVKTGFTEKGYFEYQITRGNAFWLDFREWGTSHQSAQPMFRPAFDANQQRAADAVAEKLRDGITRAARSKG